MHIKMKLSSVNFLKNPPTCCFGGSAGKPRGWWKGFAFSRWAEWTEMTCSLHAASPPHPTHFRILWHFMVWGLLFFFLSPSVNSVMKDSKVAYITSTHPPKLWSAGSSSFRFSGECLNGTNLHFNFSTSPAACWYPLAQRWLAGVWLETGFFFCTHTATNRIGVGAMFRNCFLFLLHANLGAFRPWPSRWPLDKFSPPAK